MQMHAARPPSEAWLQVDIAVVEAGLGGARDATNVLDGSNLRVAVITAIGSEHADALGTASGDPAPALSGGATSQAAQCRGGCVWPSGGSLEAIAAAKAGIMKHGRPVVLARQSDDGVSEVLRRQAGLLGCPVIDAPQRVQLRSHGMHMEHDSVRESCSVTAQSRGAPLEAGERPACSMKMLPLTMLLVCKDVVCLAPTVARS